MTHVKLWLTGGFVLLIGGVIGLSALTAQRTPPSLLGGSEVGRYQAVHTSPDGIILLDTATGELYRATPNDIKPHSARPRGDRIDPERRVDRDFPIKDLKDERFKDERPTLKDEKPRFKDEDAKDKPRADLIKDKDKK
jgi:hypothetical protein